MNRFEELRGQVLELEADDVGKALAKKNGDASKKKGRASSKKASPWASIDSLPTDETEARKRVLADIKKSSALQFKRICAARGWKQRDVLEALINSFNENYDL